MDTDYSGKEMIVFNIGLSTKFSSFFDYPVIEVKLYLNSAHVHIILDLNLRRCKIEIIDGYRKKIIEEIKNLSIAQQKKY